MPALSLPVTVALIFHLEQQPGSRAGERVQDRVGWLQGNIKSGKYDHRLTIRRDEGYYAWDCSAMVTWVLERDAPRARKAVNKKRPVAVSYYRTIKAAPKKRARNGWRRLAHIEDVRPGDIFAWKRPPDFPSKNTGHVGFVVETPRPVPGLPGNYWVRIADASSYVHGGDTRREEGPGGFGIGTILFTTDGEGRGTGYGWHGDPRWVVETEVVFGRVTR